MNGDQMLRTRSGLLIPESLADEGARNAPAGILPQEWRTLSTKPHDRLGRADADRTDRARIRAREDGVVRRLPDGTNPAELGPLTDRELHALQRTPRGSGGERLYQAYNGVAPTTAALVPVTTGTAIKTMLQIATASTRGITIVEWGISFDGSAAAVPGKCEFFGCTGAATVTTLNAADIVKFNNPNDEASTIQLGTSLSGFTASGEGTVANWRGMDTQHIAPTNQYVKQFPLGREPCAAISTFLRVRVTFPVAINAYCYVVWSE